MERIGYVAEIAERLEYTFRNSNRRTQDRDDYDNEEQSSDKCASRTTSSLNSQLYSLYSLRSMGHLPEQVCPFQRVHQTWVRSERPESPINSPE